MLVDHTFTEAAEVVVEQKRPGWRNPKHAQDWPASLERFAFPRFGQRSVSEVTTANVLVEAAYARSTLFERRRRLMADWAAYLTGPHVA